MLNFCKTYDDSTITLPHIRLGLIRFATGVDYINNQYQLRVLVEKDNTAAVSLIQDAGAADHLHDGDIDYPDDINYRGHYYLDATNSFEPTTACIAGTEPYFYPGCYGCVSIAFDKDRFVLGNILKTHEGNLIE